MHAAILLSVLLLNYMLPMINTKLIVYYAEINYLFWKIIMLIIYVYSCKLIINAI